MMSLIYNRQKRTLCSLSVLIVITISQNVIPSSAFPRIEVSSPSEADGIQLPKKEKDEPFLLGLTVEDPAAHVDVDGVNVMQANLPTTIRLFGENFDNLTLVAFTPDEIPDYTDLCEDLSRTDPYTIQVLNPKVAILTVILPESGAGKLYHICIKGRSRQTAEWYHQGNDNWLKIRSEGKMLPLGVQILLICFLLCLSGLFAGLNLGLMSLDKNELRVIASLGTESEKRYAKAIEPLRRRGNYLLCTILLSNVLINSTLTVLLDQLTSGFIAIATSTMSIVIIGDIIPQAICSRHGLAVGAKTIWITYLFMVLTTPLSYPISKILDFLLGDEIGQVYDRERLVEYIRVTKDYNRLDAEEVNIISGALELRKKKVVEIMTRLEDVFMLSINSALDFETVSVIQRKGYSRIPVYQEERKDVVALFHAKDLAFVDPNDNMPIKTLIEFYKHPLIYTYEDTTLDIVLSDFKEGRSHLAFVRQVYDHGDGDPYVEVTGVVTLEDVIEEILQAEIVDETDTLMDNRRKQKRKDTINRHDFSDFAKIGEGSGNTFISPQMALATYQFLSTSIEPFGKEFISQPVLRRLMAQKVYFSCKIEEEDDGHETGRPPLYLFQANQPVDYFVMILEGRVRVTVGQEGLVFVSGPFSYFGVDAIKGQENGYNYVPDFTVEFMETTMYIKISRSVYQYAYKATLMDKQAAVEPLGLTMKIDRGLKDEDMDYNYLSLGMSEDHKSKEEKAPDPEIQLYQRHIITVDPPPPPPPPSPRNPNNIKF